MILREETQYLRDQPISGVNVLPLVSVCLVLVMVFMVTAPFLTQPTLDVELPKAKTAEPERTQNVTITITSDGRFAVNDMEVMNWKELSGLLKLRIVQSRDKFVIIRADKEAKFWELTEAMDIAKKCGAKKLTIATEQTTDTRGGT
jgi:biopolymer transport protein ExbD